MTIFCACRKSLATLITASFLLSACASNQTHHTDGTPLTPAELRLRERNASYNQTIAEGAMIGCAVGALLGAFVVSDGGNRGSSAAIGCGAGAAIGAGAGVAVAEEKESYAKKEDQYNAMIAEAKKTNENIAADIADMRDIIANDRSRMDQIDRNLASGTISKKEALAEMQRIDDNLKFMTSTMDSMKKKRDEYKKIAQKGDTEMQREVALLEKQIAQMENEVSSLVRRRQVSRVG